MGDYRRIGCGLGRYDDLRHFYQRQKLLWQPEQRSQPLRGDPMFTKHQGTSTLEWVICAVIVISIIGVALYTIGQTISTKLNNVNLQLGS